MQTKLEQTIMGLDDMGLDDEEPCDETLKLKSGDGDIFVINTNVAIQSEVIRVLLENVSNVKYKSEEQSVINLRLLKTKELKIIVDYMNLHFNNPADAFDKLDKNISYGFDKNIYYSCYEMVYAANYMGINSLLNHICEKLAHIIQKKLIY